MNPDALLPPLDGATHLNALRQDVARLRALARELDPSAPVPGCPGWTVEDVVRHVADVYLRQSTAIAVGHRVPPGDAAGAPLPDEAALAHLDRGTGAILAAVDRPSLTPCWTWPTPDGRLSFWQRRMAQETLIHRVDLEQAAGEPSLVDPALALDGIDEVLTVFLPLSLPADGPSSGIGPDLRSSVVVEAGGRAWGVEVTGAQAEVRSTDPTAAATVRGAPDAVLLWLWGRGDRDALTVDGDGAHVAALRRALAAATQ
ncbi:maleylpyruvate isomerase family mycothiol-dependent enzyme [Cellulomonas marina]|uniref:maleylpyruvate isomerase family mycothiol-dependent enzyme n=1 Tax=Cellulomonas marina TaxID=988821 RepID=UPI001587AAAC|nr:maleylpyruvate isomerase family mycothiol-dependent enzyme [Cellulomonas marina]